MEQQEINYRATTLEISCPEEWAKALDFARETRDDSLRNCIWRLMNWCGIDRIRISKDYGKHCFYFTTWNGENMRMNGGIIYHGNPDEGYMKNGSVQLTPSYGWQIHT